MQFINKTLINGITIRRDTEFASQSTTGYTISGSDDGNNFTTIFVSSTVIAPRATIFEYFSINNSYYFIRCTLGSWGTGGYFQAISLLSLLYGVYNSNNKSIINVIDPFYPQVAATKNYVDIYNNIILFNNYSVFIASNLIPVSTSLSVVTISTENTFHTPNNYITNTTSTFTTANNSHAIAIYFMTVTKNAAYSVDLVISIFNNITSSVVNNDSITINASSTWNTSIVLPIKCIASNSNSFSVRSTVPNVLNLSNGRLCICYNNSIPMSDMVYITGTGTFPTADIVPRTNMICSPNFTEYFTRAETNWYVSINDSINYYYNIRATFRNTGTVNYQILAGTTVGTITAIAAFASVAATEANMHSAVRSGVFAINSASGNLANTSKMQIFIEIIPAYNLVSV